MWAHIERSGMCERQCSGHIRIFEDGQKFGDPYRYDFPFTMLDDTTIELHGIIGKDQGGRVPTKSECKAMLIACLDAGLTVVRERKTGARVGIRDVTKAFKGE